MLRSVRPHTPTPLPECPRSPTMSTPTTSPCPPPPPTHMPPTPNHASALTQLPTTPPDHQHHETAHTTPHEHNVLWPCAHRSPTTPDSRLSPAHPALRPPQSNTARHPNLQNSSPPPPSEHPPRRPRRTRPPSDPCAGEVTPLRQENMCGAMSRSYGAHDLPGAQARRAVPCGGHTPSGRLAVTTCGWPRVPWPCVALRRDVHRAMACRSVVASRGAACCARWRGVAAVAAGAARGGGWGLWCAGVVLRGSWCGGGGVGRRGGM